MQEIVLKIYSHVLYTFSTDFNRVINIVFIFADINDVDL